MEYKVILVGDGGVGKDFLVRKMKDINVSSDYITNMGTNVHPLVFDTNYGSVSIKLWDAAGKEKLVGLKEGYHIQSDAGIIMCDFASDPDLISIWNRIKDIRRVCIDLPMLLCRNRSDMKNYTFINFSGVIDISANTGEGVNELIVQLLRRVTKKSDLQIL